ncbi:hypothetical protein, partial [Mycobacteroides abscessus]|uniref:hypothetical protein n=1 Tax=Mycobacteroides abscessus TaxID=36809 RepID=UPI001C2CA012
LLRVYCRGSGFSAICFVQPFRGLCPGDRLRDGRLHHALRGCAQFGVVRVWLLPAGGVLGAPGYPPLGAGAGIPIRPIP